jgi:signal transduction histidine kinase
MIRSLNLKNTPADRPDVLRVDVAARPFAATILFLAALLLWSFGVSGLPLVPIGILAAIEVVLIIPYYYFKKGPALAFRRYLELLLDVLLITLIIYLFGGSDASFLTLVYVIVIMYAGFVISPNTAATLAVLSGVSYAALFLLEQFGVIPHYSIFQISFPPQYLLASLVFNLLVFAWTAVLVVLISRRIREIHLGAVEAKARLEHTLQRLESTQAQLLQSAKMAAVGQLVSGVAHELNNPLAGVMGYSELLLGKDINENSRASLKKIYSEAQRAARIVKNLLSFSRAAKPEKRPVAINDLIRSTLELRNYELRVNNITVQADLSPSLPITVVNNAEQAILSSAPSGSLLVKSFTNSHNLLISFTDDGPGIPQDNLDKVFDPFFTTKEVGKGTGLGLSICYGIIAEHGGKIYAQSPPVGRPHGACVTIELPLVSEQTVVEPSYVLRPEQPSAPSPQPLSPARP